MYTRFPTPKNIELAYTLVKYYCDRFFPTVPYKKLLTTTNEVDRIHGEIEEGKKQWAEDFIDLRAYVVPDRIIQRQTKFALEEERKCDLSVSVPSLVEAGLATQDDEWEVKLVGRIGDHFYFHDVEYEIVSFVPSARFGNTDLIVYYNIHAERYHAVYSD